MKKLFLFFAFFGMVSLTANAQDTVKTATAKKSCSATASKACCAKTAAAAAKLASMDESIEAKTCSKSGKVSYYKNAVCSKSGKVTSTEVKYDAATQKFVNVSPTKMAKEAAVGGVSAKKVAAAKKKCDPAACKKMAKNCDPKNCDPAACKKSTKAAKAKLTKSESEQ